MLLHKSPGLPRPFNVMVLWTQLKHRQYCIGYGVCNGRHGMTASINRQKEHRIPGTRIGI